MGVSADEPEPLRAFAEETGATFPMISDPRKDIIGAYGAEDLPGPKAKRVTFLIDPDGIVSRRWEQMDVQAHADEVLNAVREEAVARVP